MPVVRRTAALAWLPVLALVGSHAASAQPPARPAWVGAWATSQIVPAGENVAAPEDLTDATLRQIVRLTLATGRVRVRLSNAFGQAPLAVGAVTIARPLTNRGSAIDPATLRRVTFNGRTDATIPAGADIWSDPIAFAAADGSDLAISLYLPRAPDRQTAHPGSRATSYFVHGDRTGAANLSDAKTMPRWFVIGGVEAEAPRASAVVIFGDSITDGYGVQPDTNLRWPDALKRRMQADSALRSTAVLNAGIGGNRLLLDGLGPNALARFDRDVLSVPGITHLVVLEGINDLGTLTREAPATPDQHRALVQDMIAGLRQIVARARTHGIVAIGGTIMPDGASAYYHPDAANEADRAAVNAWIRAPSNFDAVIDFDRALRDPARPTHLRKALDSGDGLHPSPAGYQAMADAVPLSLFRQAPSKARAGRP